MKEFIGELFYCIGQEISYRLRLVCGKPSPMKRFLLVLGCCTVLGIVFIYMTVHSIHSIGKSDTGKELIETGRMKPLRIAPANDSMNDSINLLKQKMYE
ncbi:hypothetical protein EZS27_011356 [termite gut metagenome]|uniref:DUF3989 domain-containing protein n=1 Tax=termite gut metagenome TaxID=433724 RepID=A0A5J4S6D5_9ZZZZ